MLSPNCLRSNLASDSCLTRQHGCIFSPPTHYAIDPLETLADNGPMETLVGKSCGIAAIDLPHIDFYPRECDFQFVQDCDIGNSKYLLQSFPVPSDMQCVHWDSPKHISVLGFFCNHQPGSGTSTHGFRYGCSNILLNIWSLSFRSRSHVETVAMRHAARLQYRWYNFLYRSRIRGGFQGNQLPLSKTLDNLFAYPNHIAGIGF
jgi:hypothetical protein